MKSDTPRTDAAWIMFSRLGMINAGEDFARQLERELNDTNAVSVRYAHEIDRLKEEIEQNAWKSSPALAQAQHDQLTARIGLLEEALRGIVELSYDELAADNARAAINGTWGQR